MARRTRPDGRAQPARDRRAPARPSPAMLDEQPRGDVWRGNLFFALLLLAVVIALAAWSP